MILEYGQQVGDAHRKSFGQFFTHPRVAEFMVRWVLGSGGKMLFDPAFGLGAFRAATPSGTGVRFSGFELDPDIIRFWEKWTGENADFVAMKDYLGTELSGYTNIASAFLLKSLSELDERGRLAYIMPLEFLNTGYERRSSGG